MKSARCMDPVKRARELASMLMHRATKLRTTQSRAVGPFAPAPAARRLQDLGKLLRWEADCAGLGAPRGRVVHFVANETRTVADELLPHIPAWHSDELKALALDLGELAATCWTTPGARATQLT